MNKLVSLVAGLIIWCVSAVAQTGSFADTAAQLDKLFQSWNTHTPGGVLTIARGDRILYNKAGGMANLEHHIANTPATIFEAGSVSKQFTATAVLMLAEEGKLQLDDDIRKYIPELPDYGKTITIKHLLVHTSGLKDWGTIAAFGGWPRGTRAYTQDHAREIIFRQKTLNFAPGTKYSYSNSNYTLLTTLVERVSGQSLAAFTRKRIFEPVGMKHTSWRDDFRKIVPNRAVAYDKKGRQYIQFMPFENTHGHAALLTTTEDLLKWLRYWAKGKFGPMLSRLREEQGITNDGQTISYAAGAVRVATFNGVREVSHSGATAGYRAWLAWYPEKELSVVYLSNDGSTIPTSAMGAKVAEVFFGKPPVPVRQAVDTVMPHKPDPKDYIAYAGKYYSEDADALFTVQVKGDTLVLFRSPSTTMVLKPVSHDTFIVDNSVKIEFIRDRKNKVTGFYGSAERALRIPFTRIK